MNNKNTQIHDNIKQHMATIYKMPQSPINENHDKLVGLEQSKITMLNFFGLSDHISEHLYNDYSTNNNGLKMTGPTSG